MHKNVAFDCIKLYKFRFSSLEVRPEVMTRKCMIGLVALFSSVIMQYSDTTGGRRCAQVETSHGDDESSWP